MEAHRILVAARDREDIAQVHRHAVGARADDRAEQLGLVLEFARHLDREVLALGAKRAPGNDGVARGDGAGELRAAELQGVEVGAGVIEVDRLRHDRQALGAPDRVDLLHLVLEVLRGLLERAVAVAGDFLRAQRRKRILVAQQDERHVEIGMRLAVRPGDGPDKVVQVRAELFVRGRAGEVGGDQVAADDGVQVGCEAARLQSGAESRDLGVPHLPADAVGIERHGPCTAGRGLPCPRLGERGADDPGTGCQLRFAERLAREGVEQRQCASEIGVQPGRAGALGQPHLHQLRPQLVPVLLDLRLRFGLQRHVDDREAVPRLRADLLHRGELRGFLFQRLGDKLLDFVGGGAGEDGHDDRAPVGDLRVLLLRQAAKGNPAPPQQHDEAEPGDAALGGEILSQAAARKLRGRWSVVHDRRFPAAVPPVIAPPASRSPERRQKAVPLQR